MTECNKCFHYNVCNGDVGFGYAECSQFISTKDMVEVVRCENCKFYRPFEEVEDFDGRCILHGIEIDNEFYCQYGIKKVD